MEFKGGVGAADDAAGTRDFRAGCLPLFSRGRRVGIGRHKNVTYAMLSSSARCSDDSRGEWRVQ